MHKAVVFDIGNTIVRSGTMLDDVYVEVFKRYGIPPEKIQEFKRFSGGPKDAIFREFLPVQEGVEAVIARCMADLTKLLVERACKLDEMPGASSCLKAISASGLRIAIISGFPRVVCEAMLKSFGWNYPVVGAEDVGRHRPYPDLVLKACELIDVDPREALVVGDTPRDIATAQRAGATAVAVATGKFSKDELESHRPAFVIASLSELPALIQRGFTSVT